MPAAELQPAVHAVPSARRCGPGWEAPGPRVPSMAASVPHFARNGAALRLDGPDLDATLVPASGRSMANADALGDRG